MKYFSLLEPPSEKFIEMIAQKFGWNITSSSGSAHPQEDSFVISSKYPIFVVADGVTLVQFLDQNKEYPNPSPAGDVAKIFCQEALRAAESSYESFEASDMQKIFQAANTAVGKHNEERGRTKSTVDYYDTDFYAATAAIVVIKEATIFWGTICDSYVMRFDARGTCLLRSPECQSLADEEAPTFTGDKNDRKAKTQYAWKVRRNGVNEKGKRIGYGVITGEPEALKYLSTGSFVIHPGDYIAILTDGFEEYVKLQDFISLFNDWPDNLEQKVKEYTLSASERDPEKFGHERTLIMISP